MKHQIMIVVVFEVMLLQFRVTYWTWSHYFALSDDLVIRVVWMIIIVTIIILIASLESVMLFIFFSFCFVSGSPSDILLYQMQLAFSELMHLICFIMIVISTSAPTGAAAAVLLPVTALCGVISVRVSRWVYGTQRCRLHYGWHSSLISPLTDDDDQHTAHHRR